MDLDITEVIEKSQNTRREELIECRRHRPVSSASWRAQLRGSFWAVPSAQQQSPPGTGGHSPARPSRPARGRASPSGAAGQPRRLPHGGGRRGAGGPALPHAPWRTVVRTRPWRPSARLSNRHLESDPGRRAASLRGAKGSAARAGPRSRPAGGKPSAAHPRGGLPPGPSPRQGLRQARARPPGDSSGGLNARYLIPRYFTAGAFKKYWL